jgi:hypothetical protein
MEQLNQLPGLSEHYELSDEQIACYQKNGHIFLKNVADDKEVNAYRPLINDVVMEHNNQKLPIHEREPMERRLSKLLIFG